MVTAVLLPGLAAALVAVSAPSPSAAQPPCIARSMLPGSLADAVNELRAGAFYAALADFNTQAVLDESCAVGWCDGVTDAQGRFRAAVAYAGSAAAYFGYGEPEQAAEPLDRAEVFFQKGTGDAAIGTDLYGAAQAGLAWVTQLRSERKPVAAPLCPK